MNSNKPLFPINNVLFIISQSKTCKYLLKIIFQKSTNVYIECSHYRCDYRYVNLKPI